MRLATLVATLVLASTGVAFAQGNAAYPPRDYLNMAGQAPGFANLDTNGDGVISRAEYLSAQHKGDALFNELDGNRDGQVTRAEFLARAEPAMQPKFDRLDTNRDGIVSRAEVQASRSARFDKMDLNRDGQLTPAEVETAYNARQQMHQNQATMPHDRHMNQGRPMPNNNWR